MMTLREARCIFTALLARLVMKAQDLGFEIAFAEGMDRITAKDPTTDHMKNSLHGIGLAQDVDLYRKGQYLSETENHQPLGEWWEQQHEHCRWGGRFTPPDGNHYSFCPPELVGNRK